MLHVCPFCALHCDDMPHDGHDGCAVRAAALAAQPVSTTPRVHGREASPEEAIAAAAALLGRARSPLLLASASDVAAARALVHLAEWLRGTLAPWPGRASAVLRPLVLRGLTILATLAEVRNRADLIVLFGTDAEALPRLAARVLRPPTSLFPGRLERRRILHVGARTPDGDGIEHLPCPASALHRLAAVLAARLRGAPTAPHPELPAATVERLLAALQAADYAIIAFSIADLPAETADMTVEALAACVRRLNERRRAALLPLSAAPVGALDRVALWQAGMPTPLTYADGAPDHEPRRLAPERLLEEGRADALLWLAPLLPPPSAPTGRPLVALHHPALAVDAEVAIPVAAPGLEAEATFFRLDSIVALRAPAVRAATLPGPDAVLRRILARLAD